MDQIFDRSTSEFLCLLSYLFRLIGSFLPLGLRQFVFAIPAFDFRSYLEVYLDLGPFAPHLSESYSSFLSAEVYHQISSLQRFVVRQHLLMTYFESLNLFLGLLSPLSRHQWPIQ